MEENDLKEKNKIRKIKFLVVGFLIVISIAIGLFIGYKKLNNNPLEIYKSTINGIYKNLNNALKESKEKSFDSIDILNEPLNFSLNAKLTSSMPLLEKYSGLNYHLTTGLDYKNKKMNLGLGIKEDNTSIINVIMSVINQNIYLKSEELYNKVIDLGEEEFFENMNLESYLNINDNKAKFDYDNYMYILKEMKTIIIDSLDKNKFEMEEIKIVLDNKEYDVKKATYNLDKENIERTSKFIKKRILKNTKLLNALASSTGVSEEELKEALNTDTNTNNINDIKINLYADKLNNIIKGNIETKGKEIINFENINDKINIELIDTSNKLKVLIESNDNIIITYNENNIELFKINFEKNANELKIPYSFNINGNTITGALIFKNMENKNDLMSADYNFTINGTIEKQKFDLKVEGNYTLEKTNINTIDPTGSIKIDNISEEEAIDIFNKLNKILQRFGLNDILGKIM